MYKIHVFFLFFLLCLTTVPTDSKLIANCICELGSLVAASHRDPYIIDIVKTARLETQTPELFTRVQKWPRCSFLDMHPAITANSLFIIK